jgi:arylsulfatase A-like enzyme
MVAALEETGQRANTLIIFTSDNGGIESLRNAYAGTVGDSPLNSENDPLRGEKGGLHEGGTRVCAFANFPGVLAPRKVSVPMHAVDWLPTLADMMHRRPEGDPQWDGVSQWATLRSGTIPPERSIYIATRGGKSLRRGDWKLILGGKGKAQLFDLGRDPYERDDLAETETARVAELRALLEAEAARDNPELPADLKGVAD